MSTAATQGCSFCGKTQGEARKLLGRPGARVCNEYLELCNDIIGEEHDQHEGSPELATP
jgi:ATP-dependent Clp protease ATP-binding subunit ClpX